MDLSDKDKLTMAHREVNMILKKYGLLGFYVIAAKTEAPINDIALPPWAVLKKRKSLDGVFKLVPNEEVDESLPGLSFFEEIKECTTCWHQLADRLQKATLAAVPMAQV